MEIVILDGATVAANDLNFKILEKFGNLTVYDFTAPDEIVERCKNADAAFCNKIVFTREIFTQLPKLKFLGLFATGYNNIDVKAAKELGITVCNAGSYSTDAVAQHTFGFILNNYTRIADYSRFVLSGGWTVSKVFSPVVFPTDEIKGKTLGIIGYGSIGKKVAEIARVQRGRVELVAGVEHLGIVDHDIGKVVSLELVGGDRFGGRIYVGCVGLRGRGREGGRCAGVTASRQTCQHGKTQHRAKNAFEHVELFLSVLK